MGKPAQRLHTVIFANGQPQQPRRRVTLMANQNRCVRPPSDHNNKPRSGPKPLRNGESNAHPPECPVPAVAVGGTPKEPVGKSEPRPLGSGVILPLPNGRGSVRVASRRALQFREVNGDAKVCQGTCRRGRD